MPRRRTVQGSSIALLLLFLNFSRRCCLGPTRVPLREVRGNVCVCPRGAPNRKKEKQPGDFLPRGVFSLFLWKDHPLTSERPGCSFPPKMFMRPRGRSQSILR